MAEGKKYELTDETIEVDGHILHRIRALREFYPGYSDDEINDPDWLGLDLDELEKVSPGDLGGFVEDECNLSHDEGCWVADDAKVFGYAIITGNAKVQDRAVVCGWARIEDDSVIYGNAQVSSGTLVRGHAAIFDNAHVSCRYVDGCAMIYGEAEVTDNAIVIDTAKIYDSAQVDGAIIAENAVVFGNAEIHKSAVILRYSMIGPGSVIYDKVITGTPPIRQSRNDVEYWPSRG